MYFAFVERARAYEEWDGNTVSLASMSNASSYTLEVKRLHDEEDDGMHYHHPHRGNTLQLSANNDPAANAVARANIDFHVSRNTALNAGSDSFSLPALNSRTNGSSKNLHKSLASTNKSSSYNTRGAVTIPGKRTEGVALVSDKTGVGNSGVDAMIKPWEKLTNPINNNNNTTTAFSASTSQLPHQSSSSHSINSAVNLGKSYSLPFLFPPKNNLLRSSISGNNNPAIVAALNSIASPPTTTANSMLLQQPPLQQQETTILRSSSTHFGNIVHPVVVDIDAVEAAVGLNQYRSGSRKSSSFRNKNHNNALTNSHSMPLLNRAEMPVYGNMVPTGDTQPVRRVFTEENARARLISLRARKQEVKQFLVHCSTSTHRGPWCRVNRR